MNQIIREIEAEQLKDKVVPDLRPGILGIFQKPVTERFRHRGVRIVQHPGHQPGYGIHHHHGRQLPAIRWISTVRWMIILTGAAPGC